MSDEMIAATVSDFVKSFSEKNIAKVLSLFHNDAIWIVPEGTLSGQTEFRQYLARSFESNGSLYIADTGINLIVQGNSGVLEYVFSGTTSNNTPWEVLAFCTFEFNGSKIKRLTTVYDRLAMAQQTASDWMAKMAVNSVVNRMEKGLH